MVVQEATQEDIEQTIEDVFEETPETENWYNNRKKTTLKYLEDFDTA